MGITIYPLRYSKAELGQVPEHERQLHLAAGQLLNDLHFLGRLAVMAMNGVEPRTPEGRASTGLALMLLRQLAGRAYDGGILLKVKEFQDVIYKYLPDLTPRAKVTLPELEAYFGKENLLAKIRNKTSAHLDLKVFRAGYLDLPKTEELVDYNSDQSGNTYYHSSAIVGVLSLRKITRAADSRSAIDTAIQEALRVTNMLDTFLGDWIGAFVDKRLPSQAKQMMKERFTIQDTPSIQGVRIPMFTST